MVAAPFDDYAGFRRARKAGHERDWRSQDQRAGRRDDEDGERADRIAGDGPGDCGDELVTGRKKIA